MTQARVEPTRTRAIADPVPPPREDDHDIAADAPLAVRLRSAGLSYREVGGELVVLDFDGSQYFTIHGSGVLLFEMLKEQRTREELVAALLARFDVDEMTARRGVDSFLADLTGAGLLST